MLRKTVETSKRRNVKAWTCFRFDASTLRRFDVLLLALIAACASTGDPPGGAPDRTPPTVLSVSPESGAVLGAPPAEARITFDEVISERTGGQPPDISAAVLLSPTAEAVRVQWKRDHITVRPKSGFQAGRIYHLELLPVITDLRTNRMRAGRTIVFSTGPAIPDSRLEGTVVDWVAGRPAARALIEAVLMPDSLVYRTLADSGGVFRLSQVPPGHYRVYGVIDQNNDRRRGLREIYDSAGVDLDSVAPPLELYAFARDTVGPRLRQTEVVDSMTLKLTFDRPLDPTLVLDTAMVTVAALEDSTTALPLLGVYTLKGLDSAKTRADSIRRAAADTLPRVPADSLRPPAGNTSRGIPPDTTRRVRPDTTRRAPGDTTRARARAGAPVRPPVRTPQDSTWRTVRPPLDSTRADRMIARHPAPTDVRIVQLAEPLVPGTRYVVFVRGARSLSGNAKDGRGQVRAPRPARQAPGRPVAKPDSAGVTPPDSTQRDSTPMRADSARPAPRDSTTPPVRRP